MKEGEEAEQGYDHRRSLAEESPSLILQGDSGVRVKRPSPL